MHRGGNFCSTTLPSSYRRTVSPCCVSIGVLRRRATTCRSPFRRRMRSRRSRPSAPSRRSSEAPLGLWAWSQGAWAAPLAAAWSVEVGFLVLVAGAGVSPAEQMRYGTAEQLRRAGYGAEALSELAELRSACERVLRGDGGLAEAQATIDRFAERPWFSLAYLPRTIPPEARWTDIDFDPEPVFEQVRCPVLLFYGEHDEWTPIDATLAAWSRAGAVSANDAVRVVRLAGADHAPTIGGRLEASAISPAYEQALLGWLDEILPSGRRAVG